MITRHQTSEVGVYPELMARFVTRVSQRVKMIFQPSVKNFMTCSGLGGC